MVGWEWVGWEDEIALVKFGEGWGGVSRGGLRRLLAKLVG